MPMIVRVMENAESVCGQKHHQSLCKQHPPAQPTENNDSKETLTPTTTLTVAKTKNNILLQTAHSRAYTSDNRQQVGASPHTSRQWEPTFLYYKLT